MASQKRTGGAPATPPWISALRQHAAGNGAQAWQSMLAGSSSRESIYITPPRALDCNSETVTPKRVIRAGPWFDVPEFHAQKLTFNVNTAVRSRGNSV